MSTDSVKPLELARNLLQFASACPLGLTPEATEQARSLALQILNVMAFVPDALNEEAAWLLALNANTSAERNRALVESAAWGHALAIAEIAYFPELEELTRKRRAEINWDGD